MGTRADFYVGVGKNAEWIGSVAWDGDEWAEEGGPIMEAETEDEFRGAVEAMAADRDDWTSPEMGWPWPWDDSETTDYTYYFHDGAVSHKARKDWPNMREKMNVATGNRSGVIVVG